MNSEPNEPKRAPGRPKSINTIIKANPEVAQAIQTITDTDDIKYLSSIEINNLEQLYQYVCFELSKAAKEGLLRGKTFCEYVKTFQDLLINKEKFALLQKEQENRRLIEENKKEDFTEYVKVVLQAITDSIDDFILRKKITDKIVEIYESRYPNTITQTTDKSLSSEANIISPPA